MYEMETTDKLPIIIIFSLNSRQSNAVSNHSGQIYKTSKDVV